MLDLCQFSSQTTKAQSTNVSPGVVFSTIQGTGVLAHGGGVPEQYDSVIGGIRLVHSMV